MKKILILLMAFVISVTLAGCGGGKTEEPSSENGIENDLENHIEEDDEAEEEDGKIDIDNIMVDEDEMKASYDFGLNISSAFGMSGAVKKISYSNLSNQKSKPAEMTETAAKSALTGDYPVFSEYEEDDADSVDKIIYVIGMEDDDSEKSFIECGAYHNADDNKYYQYTLYASQNFYSLNSGDISAVLKEIKSAYGVNLSKSKVEKAVKDVLKKVKETEDYYSLYETRKIKEKDYNETVNFAVEGFITEDNETGYYISIERERCYN